jgi:hypothetical protein
VKALFLWPGFPYLFQAVFLLVFVGLAVLGWSLRPPEGVPGKLYAKTNLVNLLIWGIWWPAMIWITVLFGRIWCAVCPLELVTNGAERLGRRLGLARAVLGRWLRTGAAIFVIYAIIQLLVAGVHLHRNPYYTSIFLWLMLAAAFLSGLWWRDRAFCRGLCPVGLLLCTYGRGAMLAVRASSQEACDECTSKDCVAGSRRYLLDARSCPSLLNPSKLADNVDCLYCGQCFKACQPQDNMGLYLRWPFSRSDAREPLASWPVTLFVMLVSGFVAYELCSEWKAAKAVFLWAPETAVAALHLSKESAGWLTGLWRLAVVPLALWLALGGIVRLLGGARSMAEAWRRLALPMVVLIAAGHMAKGLAKLASWAGYLPLALGEPGGLEHATAIASGTVAPPQHLLPMSVIAAVGCALLLLMGYYSLRESRLADESTHSSRIPAVLLTELLSLFLVLGWWLGT